MNGCLLSLGIIIPHNEHRYKRRSTAFVAAINKLIQSSRLCHKVEINTTLEETNHKSLQLFFRRFHRAGLEVSSSLSLSVYFS